MARGIPRRGLGFRVSRVQDLGFRVWGTYWLLVGTEGMQSPYKLHAAMHVISAHSALTPSKERSMEYNGMFVDTFIKDSKVFLLEISGFGI